MAHAALPRPLAPPEAALVHGPDRRTTWMVLGQVALADPVDATTLDARLAGLVAAVPLVGARLRGDTWVPGTAPTVETVRGDPRTVAPALDRALDLREEPPVRVRWDATERRLAVAVHHAAFDGLGLTAVLRALLGGVLPQPRAAPRPAATAGRGALAARLLRPADRVAPTDDRTPGPDVLAQRDVDVAGAGVTARLAVATTRAAGEHNRRHDAPLRRVGISLGVGGEPGAGNVATHRRVDVPVDGDVAGAVERALALPGQPPGVRSPWLGRALAPLLHRFSDTVLVSNLGVQALPGVSSYAFHPVARGRSAVAVGAAAVRRGRATVTLRARDLDQGDAEHLLEDLVAAFAVTPSR
jgi:hypothetical protein